MTYQHGDYASEFQARAGEAWGRAVAYAKGDGPPPEAPWQVEIHPHVGGDPVCRLHCVDCHGQFLSTRWGPGREEWIDLADQLVASQVKSLVVSGAYTDPSFDENLLCELLAITGPKFGVKLHTYALDLTERLTGSIINAAEQGPTGDSYVTISKVTRDPVVYQRMCRPKLPVKDALSADETNLLRAMRSFEEAGNPLTLRLNCRLIRINATPTLIADLLGWVFLVSDTLSIRFTTDYVPTNAPIRYREWFEREVFVPPGEAGNILREALDLANATDKQRERVSFRDAESSVYEGDRCYNGILFAAVSSSGGIFPCQGIASPEFSHVQYGNIRLDRFLDAWRRYVEGWRSLGRYECPRCVASCERQINVAVDREVRS